MHNNDARTAENEGVFMGHWINIPNWEQKKGRHILTTKELLQRRIYKDNKKNKLKIK